MNRLLKFVLIGTFSLLVLFVLGYKFKEFSEPKLTIAASATPHAKILNSVVDDFFAKTGIKLEIIEMKDTQVADSALREDSIDANFIQHKVSLDTYNEKSGTNFVSVGSIHIEPFALYCKKIKSVDEIPANLDIIIPSSAANQGRAFSLLSSAGVFKFKPGTKIDALTLLTYENALESKTSEINFTAVAPNILTKAYESDEGDCVFINANYALQAGLFPVATATNPSDALIAEDPQNASLYANLLVVKPERANDKNIQTLIELLQSEKTQKFINDEFGGQVIPYSGKEGK